MAVDPETGLMVNTDGYKLVGFTLPKKLQFLELAPLHWPHISRLCELVGITRQTFSNHYKIDEKFRELVDAGRELALDEAENAMRVNSIRPGGFMDRIALLKAYRPERWNPEHRLTVTHDVTVTKAIAQEARQVIDTTGVKA